MNITNLTKKGMVALGILDGALVLYGLWLVPSSIHGGVAGLAGCLFILACYTATALFGINRIAKLALGIPKWALLFGLVAGLVFASEILGEYLFLPDSGLNARLGYLEFGSVFLIYLLSGIWAAVKTKRFKVSLVTALLTAMIASLIWLFFVLSVFYLFHDSVRQIAVLKAEGDYEDFKTSGMADFNAFIVQDFWGAGFFHLLLGPVLAAVLGSFGACVGFFLKWARIWKEPAQ